MIVRRNLDPLDVRILEAASETGIEKFRRGWARQWIGPHFTTARVASLVRADYLAGECGMASRHLFATEKGRKALETTKAAWAQVLTGAAA